MRPWDWAIAPRQTRLDMAISSTGARQEHPVSRAAGAATGPALARSNPALAAPQSAEISLGARLRDWKTLAGFGLSAAIIVVFVLTAHVDPAAIWATVRTADPRYLALGLLVYFGAFLFRGLRWRLLLRRADLGPTVRLP